MLFLLFLGAQLLLLARCMGTVSEEWVAIAQDWLQEQNDDGEAGFRGRRSTGQRRLAPKLNSGIAS